jgi:hypothetical protein
LSVIFCLRIFILGLVMNIKLLSFPIHRLSVGIRVIVLLGHKFFVCYNTSSSSLKSLFFCLLVFFVRVFAPGFFVLLGISIMVYFPGICFRPFLYFPFRHPGIFYRAFSYLSGIFLQVLFISFFLSLLFHVTRQFVLYFVIVSMSVAL